jgi:sporulation protein YlmC with PRC-barrel domain
MLKHALMLSAAAMLVLAAPTMAQQSDEAQPAPSSPSYESHDVQHSAPETRSEPQLEARGERDLSEHEPQDAYGTPAAPSPSAQEQSSPSQDGLQIGQTAEPGKSDVRFYIVRPTDLRASDLIGMKVYNAQNEQIGDVADLVLDEDANLKAIVLDVGMFIGGGDHDVAVEPDTVVIEQQAPSGNRIVIHVTRESLQNAPEFRIAQAPQPSSGDSNQQ